MEGSKPSKRAIELAKGAYDLHVHSAPDLMERINNDIEIAERFKNRGMKGFVIKSHYESTAARAALARYVVPGVNVVGAITLNSAVGGLNALAVEIAARQGARLVWLPTVDAVNEPAGRVEPEPGAKLPFWAKMQHQLRKEGVDSPPVPVIDPQGKVLPALVQVLKSIAKHDMILATAHLGRDEIFAVVDAAVEIGVRRIIVTHPEFPSQNLSLDDQLKLAAKGAYLERCFTTPFTGKVSWEKTFEHIRKAGIARSILSTDLGQPHNPPVEDGIPLFIDRLLEAGFTEEEIHTMAVKNTVWLVEGGR
ncbi:MAG: DUF6282 family protein [Spirochaetes bacterium]|nr:DUF6282 family protein [Spirochaetota bacterium]